MAKFTVEMTIDGVEVLDTVTVDDKDYIKELLIKGVKVRRTTDTGREFALETNGFMWIVTSHHTSNDYEMVKDLMKDVEDFLECYEDCRKVPGEDLHKYLTLGDLREILKDYPDDSLLVGTENDLVQSIKVGYITEKIKTQHSLAGGFDYKAHKFFMKDVDMVSGWVNAEDFTHPKDEEVLLETVKETKDRVKTFASTRNKEERIGIKLW